jgi:type II secretory pathway pseudopilin PulG
MAGRPIDVPVHERGETLFEILITLILMGVVIVGILAGLASVTRLAAYNSQTTHVRNTAQSYAELLKQPVGAAEYQPCATAASYPPMTGTMAPSTSYTATVIAVHYATLLPSGAPGTNVTWGTGPCTTDLGLQRLEIEVRVGTGPTRSETVTIIKRDARCSHSYQNTDQGPC